jgi:hypothetical protein
MLNRLVLLVASLFTALPLLAAISGSVMSPDGVAIAGARVSLRAFEPDDARHARLLSDKPEIVPLASTQTDSNGAFSLESPPDAIVALTVERSGYVPEMQWIEKDEDVGALMLKEAETQSGLVRAGGKPVANAVVAILYGAFELVTRTDADGRYEAPDLGEAQRLTVIHPDFAIDDVTFAGPRGAGSAVANRSLVAGTPFTGRVVAANGETPVAGAKIRLDRWPLATSGEDGTFTIAHLPNRWSTLVASKGNEIGQRAYSKEPARDIRLERAAVVSGRVTSSKTKTAVAAAMVRAYQARSGSAIASASEVVLTDAKGNYSFPLFSGNWTVSAFHPAYGSDRITVTLGSGRQESRDIALAPLARVSGQVVDEARKPVAAARLTAESGSSGFGPPRLSRTLAVTGPDGKFSLRTEPEEKESWIVATKRGLPPGKSDSFPLAAGDRKSGVAITLPSGIEVTGRVTDANGDPLSGVAVSASEAEQGARGMMMMRAEPDEIDAVRTGSDGSFSLRVSESTWDFAFSREGYARKSVRSQRVTASESPSIEVALDPAVEITGRVTRGANGVEGVRVNAFASGNQASALSGADGSFVLSGLAAGEVRLMARKPEEFINETRSATAPANNLIIEIKPGGTIRGRAVDKSTSSPVTTFQAGVSQSMNLGGMVRTMPAQLLDFTSDDGSFELVNVPAGSTSLVVSAPGFAPARLNVSVEAGKTLDAGDVSLETGVKLAGRVTGPNGSGLANVTVRPIGGLMGGPGGAGPSARTNEQGEYTLEGLTAGDETIQFSHDDYVSTRKRVTLKGSDIRLDAQLGAGQKIAGLVVTEAGVPVAEAAVEAMSSSGTFEVARTNASGAFEIESAAPGRYRFTATKSGFAQATVEDFDVTTGAQVRLTLAAGGTVYGRVLGLAPAELARAEVDVFGSGRNFSSARVDAQGNYRLEGAPVGSVQIQASVADTVGYRTSARKVVEVTAGGSHQVDLEFRGDVVIQGRVTRNGLPLANTSVNFFPKGQQAAGAGQTDEQGHYTIKGLEEGEYNVNVREMNRGNATHATEYTVRGPATFDIAYTTASVRGRVLDAATNEPLAGVQVQVRPAAAANAQSAWMSSRGAHTDATGTFLVDDVAQGASVLLASRDGYGTETRDLTIGSSIDDLELKLMRNDGVVLKVVDARDGRAIRSSTMVFDAQGRLVHDARGMFGGVDALDTRLPLSPGSYSAFVWSNGYAGRNVTLQSPSTQTVTLTPGGTILVRSRHNEPRRIRLIDANGTPMWRYGTVPPSRDLLPSPATTTLENVATGTYTLQLLGQNDTIVDSQQLTVQEGRAVTVDL